MKTSPRAPSFGLVGVCAAASEQLDLPFVMTEQRQAKRPLWMRPLKISVPNLT
jgi:hypothetical protein